MSKKKKRTIGRMEKVDLPDLHLKDIDAKIDTGAWSSSLHVHEVKELELDGQRMVSFRLDHPTHPAYNNMLFTLPIAGHKQIRVSSGEQQLRYIVKTVIRLFGKKFETEFSLADRSAMDYPLLLGRKLLAKKFVVDVSRTHLSWKRKQKKKAKKKAEKKAKKNQV